MMLRLRDLKRRSMYLSLLSMVLFSCDREEPMPKIDGFQLYWTHRVFGEAHRSYLFSFASTAWMRNKYDFTFLPDIRKNELVFVLAGSVDKGKCPWFPMPTMPPHPGPEYCQSWGTVEIPEAWLTERQYKVRVVTPFFTQEAELIVEEGKATLFIPENAYLSSSVQEVYPLPPDLLQGSVIFSGEENKAAALAFKEELVKLGLKEATLPADRYHGMDTEGRPVDSFWEPDHYSFGLLYTLSVDMREVVELATNYFESSELNIYLYSTNGDEARFSQDEGIRVYYVK